MITSAVNVEIKADSECSYCHIRTTFTPAVWQGEEAPIEEFKRMIWRSATRMYLRTKGLAVLGVASSGAGCMKRKKNETNGIRRARAGKFGSFRHITKKEPETAMNALLQFHFSFVMDSKHVCVWKRMKICVDNDRI